MNRHSQPNYFDIAKFFTRLDELDPRLFPVYPLCVIPAGCKTVDEVLKLNLRNCEILLSVLNHQPKNPLRIKCVRVIHAIQTERESLKDKTENVETTNE